MTTDLPAGRELDALVCHRIFGHRVAPDPNSHVSPTLRGHGEPMIWAEDELLPVPPYSTDIAAAWLVVEKLRGMSLGAFRLEERRDGWAAIWVAGSGFADTAPLAICRAALKAVGAGGTQRYP